MAKKITEKQLQFISDLMSQRSDHWLDHFVREYTDSRTTDPTELTSTQASDVINRLIEEAPITKEGPRKPVRKAQPAKRKTTTRPGGTGKATAKQVAFIMKLQAQGAWRGSNLTPQPRTKAEVEAMNSSFASTIIEDLLDHAI